MTKDRVCATATGLPEDNSLDPNGMYHGRVCPENSADKILQIRGLARIGAAASDSLMNIDLEDSGYQSLFEVIHRLCNEIYPEIDDLQHKSKVGIYAEEAS